MDAEWIRIEEAAAILGLSYSGTYYRKSIGLLETRMVRQGSFQWLLFRRSQCEEQARNPPSTFHRAEYFPETMPRWSELELAQLATFIDCEGNIAIHRGSANPKALSPSHSLRLCVANTYRPVIQYLQDRFGGNIQTQLRTLKNPKWRPHYRWWVGARRALLLLELAQPYFLIKQDEVAVAIAFQRRMDDYRRGRSRQEPVATEEIAWRQEQMNLLSALKHINPGDIKGDGLVTKQPTRLHANPVPTRTAERSQIAGIKYQLVLMTVDSDLTSRSDSVDKPPS